MLKGVYQDTDTFDCRDLYLHATAAPSGFEIWSACHEVAQLLIAVYNMGEGDWVEI